MKTKNEKKMKQLEKREILKRVNALRVSAAMLLCGLPACLSSCENEVPEKSGRDPIELQFIWGAASYDTELPEARSDGGLAPEPETVLVPVGDGLLLHATLEPDLSAPLRDSETIPNNTLVMIAAYKNGTYEASAQYKVNGSSLVPTASTGKGLEISGNDTYTFAAYSINSTASVPAWSPTVAIEANSDLLYGKSNPIPIDAGSARISINLKHRFSQVRVRVVVEDPFRINGVGDATLRLSYAAGLDVKEGTLSKGAAGDQPVFSFPANSNDTAVNCTAPRIVYTNGETPFTISLNSITLGAATSTGSFSVAFNNTALLSGKKYTLRLRFDRVKFAASNIYWNAAAQKLTFDEYVADLSTQEAVESMQKQGVFFQFGSLVGISAGLTGTATEFIANTVVYVPTYNPGNKSQNWSQTTAGAQGWTSWTTLPYYGADPPTGTGDRYDDSLIKSSYNSESNWQARKGDICQFINKDYRLPYSYEFGTRTWGTGWSNGGGSWSVSNPGSVDGTQLMNTGVRNDATSYFFPASGNRYSSSATVPFKPGELNQITYSGTYWSGSAYGDNCHYFVFVNGGVWPGQTASSNMRHFAVSVRCVKK